MANLKPENVKRFIENVSKDVATKAYENGGGGGLDIVELSIEDFKEQGGLMIATIDWKLPTAFKMEDILFFPTVGYFSNNVRHYVYSSTITIDGRFFSLDIATPTEQTATTTSAILYTKIVKFQSDPA